MRPTRRNLVWLGVLLLLLGLLLVACGDDGGTAQATQEVTLPAEAVTEAAPEVVNTEAPADTASATGETPAEATTETPAATAEAPADTGTGSATAIGDVEVPFFTEWMNSPHNDAASEAFNHWNEEDPAEVPTDCAKCHSTPGYKD